MSFEWSKKQLEIVLSRLKEFPRPNRRLEQYVTDPEAAAEMIFTAYLSGDIQGKRVADIGAGTGILGLAAALLGAREVIMVEVDEEALKVAKENVREICNEFDISMQVRFVNCDVEEFYEEVDTAVMNPPFGKFLKGADRTFLYKALELAKSVYTFMNASSKPFVEAVCTEKGFRIEMFRSLEIKLRRHFAHHRRDTYLQKVDFYLLRRNSS